MESLLSLIRKEVRAERPYIVPGATEVENKLNQNECPFDLPGALKQEILDTFATIPFNRYPAEQPARLVSKLSEVLDHPADGIIAGNGSNELTHTLGLSLMSSGSGVVLPRPMFALFGSVARMFGANLTEIPPRSNLAFDMDAVIMAASSSDVHLTVVASPNNPTGLSVEFGDIRRLCDQAAGFVLIDEAYHEFNSEPSATTLLSEFDNLLIMRTLSKAFGLAGIRVGYMMGQPEVIGELMKARLPFMVDRFAEHVAVTMLSRPELIAERVAILRHSTTDLTRALKQLEGIQVLPSQTNFVIFRMEQAPANPVAAFAQEEVLVRDMSGYPELRGFLRVSAGTEVENKAFLRALESVRRQFGR